MMKIISTLSSKSNSSQYAFTTTTSVLTSKPRHSYDAKSNSTDSSNTNTTIVSNTTPTAPRYPFRNIAKSTTKSIHKLMKRIKLRQRKKTIENGTNGTSIYTLTSNSTANTETSNSSNTHSMEDDILDKESSKNSTIFGREENSNYTNMDLDSRLNSTNITSQSTSFQERISTKSVDTNFNLSPTEVKTDLPNQRTFKFVDLLKTTSKANIYDTAQTTNHVGGNADVKPTIQKSDDLDQRILEIPSSTKEIKLDQDRVIIWDELKDCIQSFGPSHDQPLNEDIHSLNPAHRDKLDQWEAKEFNKRVLSSPSFNVGTVTVRAEEIGLVLVILLLWAGAISLFINRWGKLRMLEPYQPQYTAPEPTPPQRSATTAPFININIQSTSSLSLNDNFRHSSPVGSSGLFHEWGSPYENAGHLSPRKSIAGLQSISVGGERHPSLMMTPLSSQRRVRSAVDLVSLVMQEKIHTGNQFAATNV